MVCDWGFCGGGFCDCDDLSYVEGEDGGFAVSGDVVDWVEGWWFHGCWS